MPSAQSELKACKTAASVTEVVDGFEVLRTASVAETFRLYAAITKRLAVRDMRLKPCRWPIAHRGPHIRAPQQGLLLTCFLHHTVNATEDVEATLRGVLGICKPLDNDAEASKPMCRNAGYVRAFDEHFCKSPERGRAATHL